MDITAFEIIREEILKAFSLYRVPKTDYRPFVSFVSNGLENNPNVDGARLEEYFQRLKWSDGGLNYFLASWITQYKTATRLQAIPKSME